MPVTQFDRDQMADWYARQHLNTDPGIGPVYYLRKNAPDREIRLVEVNRLSGERTDDSLEPIDFGVDTGTEGEHKLLVLDVTPAQWKRIAAGEPLLPSGWSIEESVEYVP